MCTWRASGGRVGRSKSARCVEYITVQLGLHIAMGDVAMRLLRTGRSTVQKCVVLPVSAMTGIVEVVVGGPTDSRERVWGRGVG